MLRLAIGASAPSYADVGLIVRGVVRELGRAEGKVVVVDATGVGTAVLEQIERVRPEAEVHGVVITSGQRVSDLGYAAGVPRRIMLQNMRRMVEVGIVSARPDLAGLERLVEEMASVKEVKEAGDVDDVAMAMGLACWEARPVAWVGEVGSWELGRG